MAEITKHVGRLKNSDKRCAVVFMQIPNDPNYSLVVETENLPDNAQDILARIIASQEARAAVNLGDLLGRRPSQEPGIDMLTYLHKTGRLRRTPVSNVMMYPFPNQPFPLEEIIRQNGGKIESKAAPDGTQVTEKYNPYLDRQRAEQAQSKLDIATNKLREAELLEQEARKKREEAYAYFPQLRPGYIPNEPILEDSNLDKIVDQNISGTEVDGLSLEDLGVNLEEIQNYTFVEPVEVIPEDAVEITSKRGRPKKS